MLCVDFIYALNKYLANMYWVPSNLSVRERTMSSPPSGSLYSILDKTKETNKIIGGKYN